MACRPVLWALFALAPSAGTVIAEPSQSTDVVQQYYFIAHRGAVDIDFRGPIVLTSENAQAARNEYRIAAVAEHGLGVSVRQQSGQRTRCSIVADNPTSDRYMIIFNGTHADSERDRQVWEKKTPILQGVRCR